MQAFLSLLLIAIALLGIFDASYISYELANYIIPPCGGGFDCGSVLTSKYAYLGPFSLANVGVVYYLVVFVLATLHYLEFDLQRLSIFKNGMLKRIQVIDVLLLTTTFGFFFSLYLISLMAFVIQAWCVYCLVSAISSATLFVLVQFYHSKFSGNSSFLGKSIILHFLHTVYALIAKPIFFLIDPETVHDTITKVGASLGSLSLLQFFTRWFLQFKHPILEKKLNGILFERPVGLAAGYDYNGDLTQIIPAVGFGFQTIGTVTLSPYGGNPKPTFGRFPHSKALLVNKGLKSSGARVIIQKLSRLKFQIPIGISIGSTNQYYESEREQIIDIIKCFKLFENSIVKHSYYELNISCPNTFGGEPFTTPDRLNDLLVALDKLAIKKPVYVKMPIDQSAAESLQLLKVISKHNIQGLVIGNLTKDKNNPAVLPEDRAVWKNRPGNISGKPTFERSNVLISLAKKGYGKRFTIIGTGGIFSYEDAQVKIKKGADVVQLITGMIFEGPTLISLINLQLANHLLNKRAQ